jgi:hypothetical protein
MKFFGAPYPTDGPAAPVYEDGVLCATPVGESCAACGDRIMRGQMGFLIPQLNADGTVKELPWHRGCFLESVLGPEWEVLDPGTQNAP